MMAYLAMMAVRLIELHRVLKPTGSLYLHCDPTASHYLKILLDAVFGASNFRNEIDLEAKHGSQRHDARSPQYGRLHDQFSSTRKGRKGLESCRPRLTMNLCEEPTISKR